MQGYPRKIIWTILIALTLGLPGLANAAEKLAPFKHIGRYEFYWGEVSIGYLVMDIKETDKTYSMNTIIRALGLAQVVSKHKSDSAITGTRDAKAYRPKHYITSFETRGKGRDITLDYDAGGRLKSEINLPPENRDKRPEVPMAQKKNAVDPLTAAFEVRRRIDVARNGGPTSFAIPVYDGRRLMNIHIETKENSRVVLDKKIIPAIHISGRREAVAGFTDNEKKRIPNEEPEVDLYVSDDAAMIPLTLTAKAVVGSVTAKLIKTCNSMEQCRKK